MARRYDSGDAKRRILAASVRLFLEKGYTNTKVAEILKEADVSAGSFQNIFHTKNGVLTELIGMMFGMQFGAVKPLAANVPSPAYIYAVETALQLALTELSENLRDIYVEAYTFPAAAEIIHRSTTVELQAAFGAYMPGCAESDFYEMELGTAGMMRGYMARKCDQYFTLEHKIRRFLSMSLSAFQVPEQERGQIIAFVAGVDVRAEGRKVMDALLASLSVQFELKEK
ncbi:MAG: TetR/AcrR family transcriptional regulator [Clostridiales bacterium]|nr:TetR/AcrR family transcriptional regulator [Clostridiales bacterium]MDY2834099.1 TetR/AcrR family transcriptional regulator [Candidatus Aphodomonas sp.]